MPAGSDSVEEHASAVAEAADAARTAVKVVVSEAAGEVATATTVAATTVADGAAAAADTAVATASVAASEAITAAQGATAEASAAISTSGKEFLSLIPESVKAEATEVVQQLSDKLTAEQMQSAVSTLSADLEAMGDLAASGGASVLAAVGGALAQAGEMAPDIIESVTAALGSVAAAIGPALGPIGISVGLLGALVHTFLRSKDNDKNVSTVSLWAASIKDWLLMVTSRVEKSAFSSTLPLFEGLQVAIKNMFGQIDKHNHKWRISKMASSSTFKREFDRAKTSVLELKSALHAFLDQEMQDAQEKKLAEVADSTIEVAAKLVTMDAQLSEIRELLVAANQKDPNAAQLDEESLIYAQLQQAVRATAIRTLPGRSNSSLGSAPFKVFRLLHIVRTQYVVAHVQTVHRFVCLVQADRTGDLPFKLFVPTFEMFFFDNNDLDKAQTRALKICLDKENTGKVDKPHFIKFFRAWKESGTHMEAYMQKLADEAPRTLFAEGLAVASKVSEAASEKVEAAAKGAATAAKEAATAATEAASAKAEAAKEGLKSIGGNLFGKKSPAKEPTAKAPGSPPG